MDITQQPVYFITVKDCILVAIAIHFQHTTLAMLPGLAIPAARGNTLKSDIRMWESHSDSTHLIAAAADTALAPGFLLGSHWPGHRPWQLHHILFAILELFIIIKHHY